MCPQEPDAVAATVRTLRSFLPEFAMEALAAIDGGVFCTGGLTDARRRELQEAWESLGAFFGCRLWRQLGG